MLQLRCKFLTGFILFLILFANQVQATIFLTGDIDLRYKNIDFKTNEIALHAIGFSIRKVFADKMGDRVILFVLTEGMHNFKEIMLDQGYLRYKGPLGKWNLTLGRYRLPFGLLPNYDAGRLLINTLEEETIGFSSDNGIQLSGLLMNLDWAISLSQGVGTKLRPIDIAENGLIIVNLGYQGDDFEDLKMGISGLGGKIIPVNDTNVVAKKLLAIDLTKYTGLLVMRGELSWGKEDKESLLGIFLGSDYALFPKLDLNLGYGFVKVPGDNKINKFSVGLTINVFTGLQSRAGLKLPIEGGPHEFSIQVYYTLGRIL